MDKQWKAHNVILQKAYNDYQDVRYLQSRRAETQKERALNQIIQELEWPPFADYISRNPLTFSSVNHKYGLDYITERCIGEIDKIANGEKNYEY